MIKMLDIKKGRVCNGRMLLKLSEVEYPDVSIAVWEKPFFFARLHNFQKKIE